MRGLPASLIIAVCAQVLCQVFKLVFYSIRDRRVSPGYLFTAGGMPSAHAAFVTALTVAVGIRSGVDSEVFAVACAFAAIVVYDAYRLRGQVQQQGKLLNRIMAHSLPDNPTRVSEMVGHSIPEIIVGSVLGGGLSAVATLLFG